MKLEKYVHWNLCNKMIIEVCCFPGHFVCCHISKSISLPIMQAVLFSSINKNMEVLLCLQMWPGMRKHGLCAQNISHSHYCNYLTFFVSYKHSISCIKFCIMCFIGCKSSTDKLRMFRHKGMIPKGYQILCAHNALAIFSIT